MLDNINTIEVMIIKAGISKPTSFNTHNPTGKKINLKNSDTNKMFDWDSNNIPSLTDDHTIQNKNPIFIKFE